MPDRISLVRSEAPNSPRGWGEAIERRDEERGAADERQTIAIHS
jgi:hypothetical protein